MTRKNFMFSVAAAAVLAAFNPALAQDSPAVNVSPNVGVDASVGISGNTDQSSTDIDSSAPISQSAATSSGASAEGTASASGEEKERHGKARGHDPDKLTGLDRADQVAGEHGQQGRDTAREKQGG
jgi:hypothetical protein